MKCCGYDISQQKDGSWAVTEEGWGVSWGYKNIEDAKDFARDLSKHYRDKYRQELKEKKEKEVAKIKKRTKKAIKRIKDKEKIAINNLKGLKL